MSTFLHIRKTKKDIVFSYLLFYIFFYWIFTQTVFGNRLFVYMSFISLLVALGIKTLSNSVVIDKMCAFWMPYFIYTALGYLFQSNLEFFSYWVIGLFLLLYAANHRLVDRFNDKLVLFMGIFLVIGVGFHYFFTDLYNHTIAPLYYQHVEFWSLSEYGYSGFTYQLGVTAILLNTVEMLVLFILIKDKATLKKWFYWLVVVAIVLCTFLTGKRTNSVISIIVPIVVYYIEHQKNRYRLLTFFLIALCVCVVLIILQNNQNFFTESFLFRRFNQSYADYQYGEDITANRIFIWNKAIEIFNTAPILGVGVDRFMAVAKVATGVHNIYLQCLCEQGIIGFLLFIFPLVYCLVSTVKLIHHAKNERCVRYLCFSFAIQLRYIVDGITENDNSNLMGFLFYALSIALAIDCKSMFRYSNCLMTHENNRK